MSARSDGDDRSAARVRRSTTRMGAPQRGHGHDLGRWRGGAGGGAVAAARARRHCRELGRCDSVTRGRRSSECGRSASGGRGAGSGGETRRRRASASAPDSRGGSPSTERRRCRRSRRRVGDSRSPRGGCSGRGSAARGTGCRRAAWRRRPTPGDRAIARRCERRVRLERRQHPGKSRRRSRCASRSPATSLPRNTVRRTVTGRKKRGRAWIHRMRSGARPPIGTTQCTWG